MHINLSETFLDAEHHYNQTFAYMKNYPAFFVLCTRTIKLHKYTELRKCMRVNLRVCIIKPERHDYPCQGPAVWRDPWEGASEEKTMKQKVNELTTST